MKVLKQIVPFTGIFILSQSLMAQTRIDNNNVIVDPQQEVLFTGDGKVKSVDDDHSISFKRSQNTLELREFGNITLKPLTGKVRIEGLYENGNIGGSLVLHHPGKTAGAAGDWVLYNMSGTYSNSLQFWAYDNVGCQPGGICNSRLTIQDQGNVGIGTNWPAEKLHIGNGNLKLDAGYEIVFADNGQIKSLDNNHRILFRRDENKMELREYGSIIFSPGAVNGTETSKVVFLDNGSVGIGTTNTGNFKLAVEGRMAAREIQVTSDIPFPDYVFDSKYKLRDLKSLEDYINQNKHLPNVPSAAEVEKNGGIELGQMNTKLLEKVEELTLYVIELKKEIEALKKQKQ